jgi:hypothetical protein
MGGTDEETVRADDLSLAIVSLILQIIRLSDMRGDKHAAANEVADPHRGWRHDASPLRRARHVSTSHVAPLVIAAVLGFVAIVVALAKVAQARDRRYRSGLLEWATARGWTYREGGGGEWTSLLPQGERRRGVKRQLEGTRQGWPVTVAHYWYETTSTSTSTDSNGFSQTSTTTHTHNLTVVVVRLAARYPAVALERRGRGLGWGLAVSRAVGRQPANLTGVEEFDRRYRIRAKGPGASVLVNPQVISAYLTRDLPLWQLSGDQFVITWPGTIKVDGLDQKVDQTLMIAALLTGAHP